MLVALKRSLGGSAALDTVCAPRMGRHLATASIKTFEFLFCSRSTTTDQARLNPVFHVDKLDKGHRLGLI